MYDVLNNITVLSMQTPILVACNKQDLPFAKRAVLIESELEKEIEEFRKVKKATQGEDASEKGIGYLETLKKKFTFADLKVPVKFIECCF